MQFFTRGTPQENSQLPPHLCMDCAFFFFFQTLPKTAALEVAEVGRVKSASNLCHTLSLGPDGALIGIFPQNIFAFILTGSSHWDSKPESQREHRFQPFLSIDTIT